MHPGTVLDMLQVAIQFMGQANYVTLGSDGGLAHFDGQAQTRQSAQASKSLWPQEPMQAPLEP